jgi:hypothetical protein
MASGGICQSLSLLSAVFCRLKAYDFVGKFIPNAVVCLFYVFDSR